jgi:methylenetetrahydrofolate dehydrogenase (NADP+)/methenyltetrahydrofolate cyclohydrolase
MSARLLDGRPVAAALRASATHRVAALLARGGGPPKLAIVRFDTAGPSAIYAAGVSRAAARVGLEPVIVTPDADSDTRSLAGRIAALGADPAVAGILVTQPVPARFEASALVNAIEPGKDVDGATAVSAGRLARGETALAPATALAVMELLRAFGISVAGRHAVVVGRSPVVGRPVAALLLAADATVTACHRATRDLAILTRQAEILVVAAGSPALITREMVSSASVVIDCGINALDGTVCGDVALEVQQVAAAVSPVPGGVGPITTMMLLRQTLDVAERLRSAE